jgi:hypothetical protein
VQYGILGPLEVRSEGMLLALGGPRQRAVLARLLVDVGRVISSDHEGADDQYRQALPELQRIGDRRCTAMGDVEEAVTLLGAATSIRDTCGVAVPLPEHTETAVHLDALQTHVDADAFTKAWEAGTKLRTDEAIDRCMRRWWPWSRAGGPSTRRPATTSTTSSSGPA